MIQIFLITAAVAVAPPPQKVDPCNGTSTIEMAQCMDGKIEKASIRLRVYRTRAINRFKDEGPDQDLSAAKAVEDAGVAFDAYQKLYCGAVYERWREGTIRYAMVQTCELELINSETRRIWEDFLGFIQDDARPLLPEPKPIQ